MNRNIRLRLTNCAAAVLISTALLAMGAGAQTRPRQRRAVAKPPATSQAAASQVQTKGIWEPVNYSVDASLRDVFFVTPDEGWVAGVHPSDAGNGGFVLHTADGGRTWGVQLGDPESAEHEFGMLRFVDPKHGWVLQDRKLLRTSDGENWEQIGDVPANWDIVDYMFLSATEGVLLDGNNNVGRILRTVDAGHTWNEVLPTKACQASIEVKGLARQVSCVLKALHFPTPTIGYAAGGSWDEFDTLFFARTEDGGNTWKLSHLPEVGKVWVGGAYGAYHSVFFTGESTGFLNLNNEKLLSTADGGQSWHSLVGTPAAQIKFADPEVGWSLDLGSRVTMLYTTNGGKRWTSREISFPARSYAFSLPRRDRAYVVGDHGMIYRYRVVPADYTAKGMLPAPLMPAYGEPIAGQLEHMRQQVAALQTKIGTVAPGGAAAPAQPGTGSEPAASGGDFSQDVAEVPASDFIQDCCAGQVQSLQNDFTVMAQQAPGFSGRFRNLNLIVVGLNMLNSLMGRVQGIRDSFVSLKKAPNAQAAAAALQDLASRLGDTSQAVTTGFSETTVSDAPGGAAMNQNGPGISPQALRGERPAKGKGAVPAGGGNPR